MLVSESPLIQSDN